jgi:hypothetical protein
MAIAGRLFGILIGIGLYSIYLDAKLNFSIIKNTNIHQGYKLKALDPQLSVVFSEYDHPILRFLKTLLVKIIDVLVKSAIYLSMKTSVFITKILS